MSTFINSSDGTRIALEDSGTGSPLVIVNGALSTKAGARAFVGPLSQGHRIVTFDRRGRDESGDRAPWAVEREIEDLAAVLEYVGAPAAVYGHSSGAILTLKAAAAGVPMVGIVSYEPPFLTPQHAWGWREFLAGQQQLLAEGRPEDVVENFLIHVGAPWDPAMREAPFWPGMKALASTIPYDLQIVADARVPVAELGRVQAPVLSLYGGASPDWARACAQAVAEAVASGSCVPVEGQSHNASPERLAPLILSFLQELTW